MRPLIIAALTLLIMQSCSQCKPYLPKHHPCISQCGMLLDTPGNGAIDCKTIDEQEWKVTNAANEKLCSLDNRLCTPQSCVSIHGWTVTAAQVPEKMEEVIFEDGGREIPIVGMSFCRHKEMWLGKAKDWRSGSYAHELLHVMQDCTGSLHDAEIDKTNGAGHEGWKEQGIFEFLKQIEKGEL